jgi:hypothetical membrane protein
MLLYLYAIYLPLYLTLLIVLARRTENYSHIRCMVSELGNASQPYSRIFNRATSIYGLISLILPYKMTTTLGTNPLYVAGAMALLITSIATMFVGIFPGDIKKKKHIFVAAIAFLNVVAVGIIFSIIPYRTSLIPKYFSYVSMVIVLTTLTFATVRLKTKSSERCAPFEWVSMIGTVTWNFLLCMFFIKLL